MVRKITVIGAGSTGHAVASVMSQRGFEVTFHDDDRFASRFQDIEELGGITLRGVQKNHHFVLTGATPFRVAVVNR